jgi:carboxyl-terminal processing protease
MRGWLRLTLFALLVVSFTSLSFVAGYGTSLLLHPVIEPSGSTDLHQEFRIFREAWRIVDENFYRGPLDANESTYGAIRGALQTLGDPFTWFAEPLVAERIREDASGRYSGIGTAVNLNDAGRVIIVGPFPGGPADLAGLRTGDVILQIDGSDTLGLSLDESVGKIRGPEGTPVTLTIQREGLDAPFEVALIRAEIEIPVLEYRILDDGVGYLKLNDFRAEAPDSVHSALLELLAEKPTALILDLRGNPGGLLSSAIDIASEFIGKGLIVSERDKHNVERRHVAQGNGLATDIPLAVLVNGGSASASEIVAGAIQDHGRGPLIGEHTFGKGAVQTPFDLSDGSHLRLTTANWFTPDGHLIQAGGIAPDIEVPLTEEDQAAGLDPQLDRALTYLVTGR